MFYIKQHIMVFFHDTEPTSYWARNNRTRLLGVIVDPTSGDDAVQFHIPHAVGADVVARNMAMPPTLNA